MKKLLTLGAGVLAVMLTMMPSIVSARPLQTDTTAKQDIKDAGRSTKRAAKKTGSATKKETKKVVNKTAKTTRKGAGKVEDKTEPR